MSLTVDQLSYSALLDSLFVSTTEATEFRILNQKMKIKLKESEDRSAMLECELKELNDIFLKNKSEAAEKSSVVELLQMSIAEYLSENEALKTNLESSRTQCSDYESDREHLISQIRVLTQTADSVNDLQNEVSSLKKELNSEKRNFTTELQKRESDLSKYHNLEMELQSKETEIARLRDLWESNQLEIGQLNKRVKDLSHESDNWRQIISEKQEAFDRFAHDISDKNAILMSQSRTIEDYRRNFDSIAEKYGAVQNELFESKRLLLASASHAADLESNLKKCNSQYEIEISKNNFDRLKFAEESEVKHLQEELTNCKTMLSKFESQTVVSLTSNNDESLYREIEYLNEICALKDKEIESSRHLVSSLQYDYDCLHTALVAIKKELGIEDINSKGKLTQSSHVFKPEKNEVQGLEALPNKPDSPVVGSNESKEFFEGVVDTRESVVGNITLIIPIEDNEIEKNSHLEHDLVSLRQTIAMLEKECSNLRDSLDAKDEALRSALKDRYEFPGCSFFPESNPCEEIENTNEILPSPSYRTDSASRDLGESVVCIMEGRMHGVGPDNIEDPIGDEIRKDSNNNDKENKAYEVLSPVILGFWGRLTARKQLRNISHTIIVKILEAKGLNILNSKGDAVDNELYVIVNTLRGTTSRACLSMAKSRSVPKCFNPIWDEYLQVCMKGDGFFSLTVVCTDRTASASAQDYVVGQVVVELNKYASLYNNEIVQLSIELQAATLTVHGTARNLFQANNLKQRGLISFSLQIPSIYGNLCGFFVDLEPDVPSKIWVCLLHDVLYFDGIRLECKDIIDINEIEVDDPDFALGGIRIQTFSGSQDLLFAWCEDTAKCKGMWHRALLDCSRNSRVSASSSDDGKLDIAQQDPGRGTYLMAISLFGNRLRGLLRGIRFQKHIRNKPFIVIVKLKSAENVNASSGVFQSTSNPYVVLNTLQKLEGTEGPNDCICIATSESKTVNSTLNPVWNENIEICMKGFGYVAFTIMSKNSITSDESLGQVILDFSRYKRVYESKIVSLRVPIDGMRVKVHNSDGLVKYSAAVRGRGHLNISLYIPPIEENICGFFWDIQTSFLGSVSGNKLWVILVHDFLSAYNPKGGADSLVYKIDVKDIERITESVFVNNRVPMDIIEIYRKSTRDKIVLAWGEDKSARGLWRKSLGII